MGILSSALVVAACLGAESQGDDDDDGDEDAGRGGNVMPKGGEGPNGGTAGAGPTGGTVASGGGTSGTGAPTGGRGGSGPPTGGAPTGGTAGKGGTSGVAGTSNGGTGGGGGAAGSGGKATAGTPVANFPAGTRATPGFATWNVPSTDAIAQIGAAGCQGLCFWVHSGQLYFWTQVTPSLDDAFYRVAATGGQFQTVVTLASNLTVRDAHAIQNFIVFITEEFSGSTRRILTSVDMTTDSQISRGHDSETRSDFQSLEWQVGVTAVGSFVYAHWYYFQTPRFDLLTFALNSGPMRNGVLDASSGDRLIRSSYVVTTGDTTTGGTLRTTAGATVEDYEFPIQVALQDPGGLAWTYVTPTGDVHRDPSTDMDGTQPIAVGQQAIGLYQDGTSVYFSVVVTSGSARVVRRWNRTTQATDTVLIPHASLHTFGVFGDGFVYYTVNGENVIYRALLPP